MASENTEKSSSSSNDEPTRKKAKKESTTTTTTAMTTTATPTTTMADGSDKPRLLPFKLEDLRFTDLDAAGAYSHVHWEVFDRVRSQYVPLLLKTPVMTTYYGLQKYENQDTSKSYVLSWSGMDKNQEVKAFFDLLVTLSNQVLLGAKANKKRWFKESDFDDALLTHIFRAPLKKRISQKGKEYDEGLRIKIPNRKQDYKFYDDNNENPEAKQVIDTVLMEGEEAKVQQVIEPTIWIKGNKEMGMSFPLVQGVKQKEDPNAARLISRMI